MGEVSVEYFEKFIASFKPEYWDSVSNISKTIRGNSLIESDFKMFSLDEMCSDSKVLRGNLPKTTDAFFYKKDKDNKLVLYIVEFKFHDISSPNNKKILNALTREVVNQRNMGNKCFSNSFCNKLIKINKTYGDNVEFSLKLKPIETVLIALPALFEEYSDEYSGSDFIKFLGGVRVKLFVFVSDYSENGFNVFRDHLSKMSISLNMQYDRLKYAGIIDDYLITSRNQFEYFLEKEFI